MSVSRNEKQKIYTVTENKTGDMSAMSWMPFFAEFLGTLLFLQFILLTLRAFVGPAVLIAALVGFGLFAGIFLSGLLGGPGYLNPAVALMLGFRDHKSGAFIAGMIAVELLATLLSILVIAQTRPALDHFWRRT